MNDKKLQDKIPAAKKVVENESEDQIIKLLEDTNLSEDVGENVFKYLSNKNEYEIPYSRIMTSVQIADDEMKVAISSNLLKCIEYAKKDKSKNRKKVRSILRKINEQYETYSYYETYIHNLLKEQSLHLSKVEEQGKGIIADIESHKENLNNVEKNITTHLISLIAIFTALAFLVFGGTSFLTELLKNFKDTDIPKLMFIVSCWGIGVTGIFYLFTNFIFCLTDRTAHIDDHFKIFKTTIIVLISITIVFGVIVWLV